MKRITSEAHERIAGVLTTLAANQLFGGRSSDSKMPDYKSNIDEIRISKPLSGVFRVMLDPDLRKRDLNSENYQVTN